MQRLVIAILASAISFGLLAPVALAKGAVTLHGPKEGIASFYGSTRSPALTAAHKTLPFGTEVLVTNKKNGKTVVVRINDRGPFIKGRVIDVSHAAARELGMIQSGLAPVVISIVKAPEGHVVPRKHGPHKGHGHKVNTGHKPPGVRGSTE